MRSWPSMERTVRYETTMSEHEVGTMHHERETKMYLKAMKVYCDLKSGEAYKEGYEWPSLR